MLPRPHRLTRREDFRRVIRGGRKATSSTVIVHAWLPPEPASDHGNEQPARVGITVSRAVGGSVARHRVARRIRHIVAGELSALPPGSMWVIRALPAAVRGSLAEDIQRCLSRIVSARSGVE